MARIALLTRHSPLLEDDNFIRLAPQLSQLGHEVSCLLIDTLRLDSHRAATDNVLSAEGFDWQPGMTVGADFPPCHEQALDHDLIWVLSLGERATFLDKMQLLQLVGKQQRLINTVDAIMHIRSKYFLASRPDLFQTPETHAANDAARLEHIIRDKGGRWIIKPPAGSLGRDVFLTDATDRNLPAILATLCGSDNSQYAMIQRYVPEIEAGEKRVLLAGGQVLGQYLRHAPAGDHRTNLSQQGIASTCELTAAESEKLTVLAAALVDHGAWFTGVDIAYPWIIEVNVVNPGGIATIDDLTGIDLSARLASIANAALLR